MWVKERIQAWHLSSSGLCLFPFHSQHVITSAACPDTFCRDLSCGKMPAPLARLVGLRASAGVIPATLLLQLGSPWLYCPAYSSVILLLGFLPQDQSAFPGMGPWSQTEPRSCLIWGPLCPCRAPLCGFVGCRDYRSLQCRLSHQPGAPLPRSQWSEHPLEREGGPILSVLRCTHLLSTHSSSKN